MSASALASGGPAGRRGDAHGSSTARAQDRRHRCLRRGFGLAAGIGALGAVGYGVLKAEALVARRLVGPAVRRPPRRQRRLWRWRRRAPVELLVLGDSSAAGMGADTGLPDHRRHHRQRRLGARPAARSASPTPPSSAPCPRDLELQLANALDQVPDAGRRDHHDRRQRRDPPHRQGGRRPPPRDRRCAPCATLGTEVVVGTCPDLGTIQPVPQPLRLIGAALEPRHGGRPDRRRRRGRRPHRVPGRPARPRVRASARTRCSAPTGSTPRPPAMRGPPPPCCPASTPRSASGPARTSTSGPDTQPRRGRRPRCRGAAT